VGIHAHRLLIKTLSQALQYSPRNRGYPGQSSSQWDSILKITYFGGDHMPFWQRVLILVVAVLLVSFLFDLAWHYVFGFALPSYITGVVGGLTAVPLWDVMKRIQAK
jgi:hypothetical protein